MILSNFQGTCAKALLSQKDVPEKIEFFGHGMVKATFHRRALIFEGWIPAEKSSRGYVKLSIPGAVEPVFDTLNGIMRYISEKP